MINYEENMPIFTYKGMGYGQTTTNEEWGYGGLACEFHDNFSLLFRSGQIHINCWELIVKKKKEKKKKTTIN